MSPLNLLPLLSLCALINSGCKSDDPRCLQVAETIATLARTLADEHVAGGSDAINAQLEAQRPKVIEQCNNALSLDKASGHWVDCMAQASNQDEANHCAQFATKAVLESSGNH